ncbi:MAG: hypothetical protein COA54_00160 [Thiotrichaceae bacterium]|nr:MAG: hypothetical protein COA54_00160 [Thiotrichaceae bacterium]
MKKILSILVLLTPIIGLLFATGAKAEMTLDGENSTINFVSIKKGTVGEVNTFSNISGSYSDSGKVTITIALNSVETGIPIRNTRMQEMLFNVASFPTASITAQVPATIENDKVVNIETTITLSLHGVSKDFSVNVLVAKVGDRVLVTSKNPVILNAKDFGLVGGIEALRKIANLSSIPISIPVSFNLIFK